MADNRIDINIGCGEILKYLVLGILGLAFLVCLFVFMIFALLLGT